MVTLVTGTEVEIEPPPLPAVTTTTLNDLISTVEPPPDGVGLIVPSTVPAITNGPDTSDQLVIPETGKQGDPGIQGVPGEAGVDGAGSYYQVFNFAAPSTEWVMVHNTNSWALSVEMFDTSGSPVEGTVIFVDANSLRVEWYYPMAGEARVFR